MKTRKKPLILQKLEALLPRLPHSNSTRPDIEQEISKRLKGYIGEQKVDYHLKRQLPSSFTILPNVLLNVHGNNFEIDTLILSNHAIYIIEVKNYSGKITFDTLLQQFTREEADTVMGYRYPITQAEMQRQHLQDWLTERNVHHIPIHYFIAISEPSTIINVVGDSERISNVVAHAEHIPKKILQLDRQLKNSSRWNKGNAIRLFSQEKQEFNFNVLERLQINRKDIIPGVQCPKCNFIGMLRKHRSWFCPKCQYISKQAHRRAISDYFLIINNSINNKECRYFLKIDSRQVATRLLKDCDLVCVKSPRRWLQKR